MGDMSYVESWVSQPDVCRCCMSASGTWDITASYVTETGEKEVYSEMLQECYGITLSFLLQWGPSRMVCGMCVGHLRDAVRFRRQVLLAEQQFVAFRNTVTFKPVVLKVDAPRVKASSDSSDGGESDAGTIDVLGLTDSTERPVVDRMQPYKPAGKRKRQRIESDEDLDSDTPISEISKKNHVSKSIAGKNDDDNLDRDSLDSMEVVPVKKITRVRVNVKAANLINNRDLRNNITLFLKYTTILPFKFTNNTQYYCHYCDQPYLFFKDLKNHVKVRHFDITERQISRTIKYPKDLVKADISDISCRLCGSNYNSIEKIAEHLTVLHDKKYTIVPSLNHWHGILGFDMSSNKFKCHICDKEFSFFMNLSSHMNDHDSDYICHYCGQRFITQHRLTTHLHRHKNKKSMICKFCKKTFKSESGKMYHIHKKHKSHIKFNCPECSEEFTHYRARLQHMVERHKFKKPEFPCHICPKKFSTPSALGCHIRFYHLKNKKRICEICNKAFSDNWLLQRHLTAVHTNWKDFECEYCNKKFAKKYTLQMHVKIHLNDKSYVCNVCQAAFVQKCTLKSHVKARHKEIDISTL